MLYAGVRPVEHTGESDQVGFSLPQNLKKQPEVLDSNSIGFQRSLPVILVQLQCFIPGELPVGVNEQDSVKRDSMNEADNHLSKLVVRGTEVEGKRETL